MNIYLWNLGRQRMIDDDLDSEGIFQCIGKDHVPLVTGLDYDLNIYLYCLECNFKKNIGIETYEKVTNGSNLQ